jgi:hypothetical protein
VETLRESVDAVRRFSVVFDLPPKILSPNVTGAHWSTKRKATRKYRGDCKVLASLALPKGWQAQHVVLDVAYRCGPRSHGYAPLDVQNAMAALKAMVDGLVDAGVVADDRRSS